MNLAWPAIDSTVAVECTCYFIILWDKLKTHVVQCTGGCMNIRKTLLAIMATTFVSLSLAVLAAADHNAHEKLLIRLSEEGSKAAHSLLLARVAIFDGHTEEAVKLVDQAKVSLAATVKDVDNLAIKSQKSDAGPMIPIDARLTIADDFTLSPEKKSHIDEINKHLKQGETRQAIAALVPADESLTLTTVFMPLEATSKAVDEAAKLLSGGKYYEANLTLKKAEDSWVLESQSFMNDAVASPKQEKPVNTPKPEK